MLRFAARRARVQWRFLAALLSVVAVGGTLLGVCALLVTETGGRALEVAAARAAPGDVEVTAYTATVAGHEAASVAADTRALLTSTVAPLPVTTAGQATSAMRTLPDTPAGAAGTPAVAYLSGIERPADRAALTSGRWPRRAPQTAGPPAPLEAVVLEATARSLGLAAGSPVHLGAELVADGAAAVDVLVVGVARPLPGTGWQRDLLGGAGVDLTYDEGTANQPSGAFGPFIVDFADLLTSGSTLSRMELVARPDLSAARHDDLAGVARAVGGADRRLARILEGRVKSERVASALPATLATARRHQQVTDALVLAVAVLGGVLTVATLVLAGRLTADVRAGEAALLSAMGASRRRLALTAAAEAAVLAVLAAAVALPASSLLHAGITHLPAPAAAGLATSPRLTGGQLLAVSTAAAALVVLLTGLAAGDPSRARPRGRRAALAHSGGDLAVVLLAAAGWWQVRAEPVLAADTVRTLVPALLLIAGGLLALRLQRPALSMVDRLAGRSAGLTWPMAASGAARRPQATAAGLLIALACAATTFGVALDATWDRSQRDQADLAVGTDLALTLDAAPSPGDGAAVRTATGGTVSPATDRSVAVGQWLGGGDAARLVAVDTTRAGDLLRGRPPSAGGWAAATAALAPPAPALGVAVPAGATVTVTGTAGGAGATTATPKLLLQDATGLRTACPGGPVPLDGRPYPLTPCVATRPLRLVAVLLSLAGGPDGAAGEEADRVTVDLAVPATGGGAEAGDGTADGTWTAGVARSAPDQVTAPEVTVTATGAATLVRLAATLPPGGPPQATREVVATAFADPGAVPVAVSDDLASALDAVPGTQLDLTVGDTSVPVTVAGVLPAVPSAPGAAALLADLDTLSRALVVHGDLAPPVDAWWVGDPARADAAAGAAALHLGTVTTRAAETARRTAGPLSAGLPAALRLLVPAAALLLFTGVALHVTHDLQAHARQAARLRGLGMTRRQIRTMLLGQHVLLLAPVCVAGAAVGALATAVLAPLLMRADTGAPPDPSAVAQWPWPAETLAFALLLAGCLVTAGVVIGTRPVDTTDLRVPS
ncbi:FtsX-like permease family protein [Dactylosporangium aurantiacum]|uniref:FtsX-like permease family protein n=1 Tax=Dactylosporangium aurantiacum TaxID=35754 RepID=A0A9Q9IB88_9ACTN|nr:FtsX-like permease family protein [Dactylosporangium aurantiacum]MDG6108764.1 FtsX-like permease family protein [Dactylosporangium aurantiacum]UWZ51123.1 FtsX-like permease family protein [Dactylosporangium aurantiacum]